VTCCLKHTMSAPRTGVVSLSLHILASCSFFLVAFSALSFARFGVHLSYLSFLSLVIVWVGSSIHVEPLGESSIVQLYHVEPPAHVRVGIGGGAWIECSTRVTPATKRRCRRRIPNSTVGIVSVGLCDNHRLCKDDETNLRHQRQTSTERERKPEEAEAEADWNRYDQTDGCDQITLECVEPVMAWKENATLIGTTNTPQLQPRIVHPRCPQLDGSGERPARHQLIHYPCPYDYNKLSYIFIATW